jgi:hypothetical protein
MKQDDIKEKIAAYGNVRLQKRDRERIYKEITKKATETLRRNCAAIALELSEKFVQSTMTSEEYKLFKKLPARFFPGTTHISFKLDEGYNSASFTLDSPLTHPAYFSTYGGKVPEHLNTLKDKLVKAKKELDAVHDELARKVRPIIFSKISTFKNLFLALPEALEFSNPPAYVPSKMVPVVVEQASSCLKEIMSKASKTKPYKPAN